jgi:hypothetical protein
MLPFVAIPSYDRSDTIASKTLAFLKRSSYPAEKIHIFVASDEEFKKYEKEVPESMYGEIIIGVPGLKEQNNFITSFYPEDEIIIRMDDDIKSIRSDIPFLALVDIAMSHLEYRNSGLFGIMPNDDKRRFKGAMTSHLSFIIGCFFIMRNHRDIILTHSEKDDVERSILYFKRYGNVLRYQNAGVSTDYGKNRGGLQQPGRLERMEEAVNTIIKAYPGYCKVVNKNGIKDVVLDWRAVPPQLQSKSKKNDGVLSHQPSPTV